MTAETMEEVPVEGSPPSETVVEAVPDIDRIDPVPESIKLSTGYEVEVLPLKSRQFFKGLRIVTHGGANAIPSVMQSLTQSGDGEEFAGQLLGMIVFSIPEAETETIEFVQSMLKPKDLVGDRKEDEDKWRKFYEELSNPELDDLVTIVEVIVRREAGDLKALGKRLGSMMKAAQKMGQVSSEATS